MRMYNIGDKIKVTHTNQEDKFHLIGEVMEITDFGPADHQFFCGNNLFSDFEITRFEEKIEVGEIKPKHNSNESRVNNYLYTIENDLVINKRLLLVVLSFSLISIGTIMGLVCLT